MLVVAPQQVVEPVLLANRLLCKEVLADARWVPDPEQSITSSARRSLCIAFAVLAPAVVCNFVRRGCSCGRTIRRGEGGSTWIAVGCRSLPFSMTSVLIVGKGEHVIRAKRPAIEKALVKGPGEVRGRRTTCAGM